MQVAHTGPDWRRIKKVMYSIFGLETKNSLHVKLLDRFQFPSGAVLIGQSNTNVFELGQAAFSKHTGKVLCTAHNHWIMGEAMKKKRQAEAGWWFTDTEYTCAYPGDRATPV